MSSIETLGLVDRLKTTVAEFADLESALNREAAKRRSALKEIENNAATTRDAQLSDAIAEAERAFETAIPELAARVEQRRSRIDSAKESCGQHLNEHLQAIEDRKKYDTQKGMLAATRKRDSETEIADRTIKDFARNLATDQEVIQSNLTGVRQVFSGFQGLLEPLTRREHDIASLDDPRLDHYRLLNELRNENSEMQASLDEFRLLSTPQLFKHISLWFLLFLVALLHASAIPLIPRLNLEPAFNQYVAISYGLISLLCGLAYWIGRRRTMQAVDYTSEYLNRANALVESCQAKSKSAYDSERARIAAEEKATITELDGEWNRLLEETGESRVKGEEQIELKTRLILERADQRHRTVQAYLEARHRATIASLNARTGDVASRFAANQGRKIEELEGQQSDAWSSLHSDWKKKSESLASEIQTSQAVTGHASPDWTAETVAGWKAPESFARAVRFGSLQIDLEGLAGAIPQHADLAFPTAAMFQLPLALTFPRHGSILFESDATGRTAMLSALNSIILRLLASMPPGKTSFTIFDPVGLGESFSGLMHLADYEDSLINSRIWTQTSQIEEQLAELNEHMEKVIQMYLRNDYQTISEYNEQAGNIAEKYHFVVLADFPANFTDVAVRRLMSIVNSGARCGVFTLMHWDVRKQLPPDTSTEDLRSNAMRITTAEGGFAVNGHPLPGVEIQLDQAPGTDVATELLHKVGQASIDSNRVEVPFSQVATPESEYWTNVTTRELRIPIGRTGATKLQELALGRDTRQHALIAGKTGSGKSTLFHVIITNLALSCSPDEVEFYLVDFKKGVEFKCYATRHLPHAKVIAIESDREFGLSVLHGVDNELKRRGDLFRQLGAQDIAGYKKAGGTEPMPRCLLMIDEFQEFFVEDDRISQGASVLFDRIVRQGRAFGIHVLLGSQTLGGAYTLARTTIGQMVVRIALQCNEADAYLIMDENNPAPRLLTRPGEGIYNDAAGTIEGNSPFQTVWLSDDERDRYLDKVQRMADSGNGSSARPIIFEGNAPADIEENQILAEHLKSEKIFTTQSPPRIWLGAANSIKGPTEAAFRRQSGNNLLIVGQREDAATAMLGLAILALSAQQVENGTRFVLFDSCPPETIGKDFLAQVLNSVPQSTTLGKNANAGEIMGELARELAQRAELDDASKLPAIYLVIHGLQRFKKLRHEDDFNYSLDDSDSAPNPGTCLNHLITEGPGVGIHVIITCDTCNNINRALSRKAISEFEMRVVFQMSANDSASLVDSPKASNLGLYRALFYNEQEGLLETFRPYALPGEEWIEKAMESIANPAVHSGDSPE